MKKTLLMALVGVLWAGSAMAVPETVSLRVTDVTTSSCAIAWMTDVAAVPDAEVYTDSSLSNRLTGSIRIVPMADASPEVAAAARSKGIMKVRIEGLSPATRYFIRTVTRDPANTENAAFSAAQEVMTASRVAPFRPAGDGALAGFSNDLLTMKVYIRPGDKASVPGLGDLLLLETAGSPYPLSAFVGVGVAAPEGILDLNNLFGTDMVSRYIAGGEKSLLSIYRGGALSVLIHYRRLPFNSNILVPTEPVKGFFADINLDGKIDELDFAEFRKQYATGADDKAYNPDYDIDGSGDGKVDAQDFARFAAEYGRTGIQ